MRAKEADTGEAQGAGAGAGSPFTRKSCHICRSSDPRDRHSPSWGLSPWILSLQLGQPAVLTSREAGAQGRAAAASCQLTHQCPSCQPQGPR